MQTYKQKDGMIMIFRAMIMTIIALIICWFGYKIFSPVKIKQQEVKCYEKDLGDIVFINGPNGNTYKIK